MPQMDEVYRDLLLDHARRPRNLRELPGANRTAAGENPMCGDRVAVWIRLEDSRIAEISFQGSGCSICLASASVMTEAVGGKTVADALKLFEAFHAALTRSSEMDAAGAPGLGKLAAFEGVRRVPVRVKCATRAWHALQAALGGGDRRPRHDAIV